MHRCENIIDSFEKNVYKNFLQTNIPLDPVLARFSAAVSEEKSESLRLTMEEFSRLTKEAIRAKLVSRLPTAETEGSLSLEKASFARLSKSNLRGMGLRKLFEEIPELITSRLRTILRHCLPYYKGSHVLLPIRVPRCDVRR